MEDAVVSVETTAIQRRKQKRPGTREKALAKLDALQDMMALRDYVDEGPIGKRRLPLLSKKDLVDDDDEPPADTDDDDEDEELFRSASPRLVEPPDFDLIEE